MISMSAFKPHSWPPGRACSEGAVRWEHYTKDGPPFSQDVSALLAPLPEAAKRWIRALMQAVMRDALNGELDRVAWKKKKREGHVTSMRITEHRVLEIRLDKHAKWEEGLKEAFRGRALRLYFAEPAYPDILLSLSLQPKKLGQDGLDEQDAHALEADQRADEWARS